METVTLQAEARTELGTGPARALRNKGKVPAIVYGAGKQVLAISIQENEITKLYKKPNFISTLLKLSVGENNYMVLPKAVELNPITDIVRHIDFVHLEDDVQKLQVPIVFEGKERSTGVKKGGFFNIVKRTILLECPAKNIPACITIDVINMRVGQSLKAADITLPEGCRILCKPDLIIASIIGNKGGSKAEDTEAEKD